MKGPLTNSFFWILCFAVPLSLAAPPVHGDQVQNFKERERLFHPIIMKASRLYEVDPALVKAIILAESEYNPNAISRKGAKGLMQLMPRTAQALGVEDIFDPEHNIKGGVKHFKGLLNQFEGDVRLALAAYNAGSRKVRQYKDIPPFKATKRYVRNVFKYYESYNVTGVETSNVEPLGPVGNPLSFEPVTKRVNKDMLSEKTTQDIEIQKLKKELSDKDKIITEQKNRIKTLMKEIVDQQTKYRYYMKVDKEKQEGFGEKYEKNEMSKKDNFDDLKASQSGKSLTSNQKTTMEDLYHQLREGLQEEIEKGNVSIKYYKKIK